MADVILNGGNAKDGNNLVTLAQVLPDCTFSINFGAVTTATAQRTTDAAAGLPVSADMDTLHLKTNLANAFTLGGVSFDRGGKHYVAKSSGDVQTDLSPVTGNGTTVGTLTLGAGEVTLTSWPAGSSPAVTNWRGVAGAPVNGPDSPFGSYGLMFRISAAPIRSGSLTVLGAMRDGTTFNVLADSNGKFNSSRVKGRVNYTTGVVEMYFVTPSAPADAQTVDLTFLGITGVTTAYLDAASIETIRYNAVAFAYIPLNAEELGLDPVRLPSDGRVPIAEPGRFIVIGYSETTDPGTVANGDTVDTGTTRLSRVRVIGHDDATILTGYTQDLEAGTVTFTNVTGYSQPVRVEWRIEDMARLADAQITGDMRTTRALTHDFPVPGSYVSSAVVLGDLKARVSLLFDQGAWDGHSFSDAPVGDPATGTYDDTAFPVQVTNAGASTERFALRFSSTSAFQIVGEHVGVVGVGAINTTTAPVNAATGEPYFTLLAGGWGGGWAAGNILRINTVGALSGIWAARTVQQGPNTGLEHSTTFLVRGDVDRA